MAVIRTPVPGRSGPGVAGVVFINSQAQTDDPAVIAYARRHGYEVEETKPRQKPQTPKE